MKRCQQKLVEKVLRVWIAKILNETMLLDEKVCLPLNNTLKKIINFFHLKSGKHRLLHISHILFVIFSKPLNPLAFLNVFSETGLPALLVYVLIFIGLLDF